MIISLTVPFVEEIKTQWISRRKYLVTAKKDSVPIEIHINTPGSVTARGFNVSVIATVPLGFIQKSDPAYSGQSIIVSTCRLSYNEIPRVSNKIWYTSFDTDYGKVWIWVTLPNYILSKTIEVVIQW